MGLNLSNTQISKELDLNRGDIHKMASQLREDVVKKFFQGEVECDEVYIVAGHKDHPEAVSNKGRRDRRNRLRGARGRGSLEKEKPSIFGMIQRCGQVVIQMLPNVQQITIEPLINATIQPGILVYTDQYVIYNRLDEWGCDHEA